MAVEPPVVAVVWGKLGQEIDEVLLTTGKAGHANQSTLIGGEAEYQRISRPEFHMGADRGQRGRTLAGRTGGGKLRHG